ncbi:hypothetical protein IWQ60_006816 [Tieghemiomyces parasiticus]|uniref:Histone deacetylase complex subunit SAP30 Sin3 binding domain-containing protein n=1 Tax=Tieghemiomyces parasiticus TaxID=78921 RepID=A0A9W8DSP0_9FUNG|nr:hypothetical protein IWQ60_006816 [Tieghemiomyces parasiticus]
MAVRPKATSAATQAAAAPSNSANNKHTAEPTRPPSAAKVDFSTMSNQSLRRYRQVHKLNVKTRPTKDELVTSIAKHFAARPVDEVDTIARFLFLTRTRDRVLKPPSRLYRT